MGLWNDAFVEAFARCVGHGARCGMPASQGLAALAGEYSGPRRALLERLSERLSRGERLAPPLADAPGVPPILPRLAELAEENDRVAAGFDQLRVDAAAAVRAAAPVRRFILRLLTIFGTCYGVLLLLAVALLPSCIRASSGLEEDNVKSLFVHAEGADCLVLVVLGVFVGGLLVLEWLVASTGVRSPLLDACRRWLPVVSAPRAQLADARSLRRLALLRQAGDSPAEARRRVAAGQRTPIPAEARAVPDEAPNAPAMLRLLAADNETAATTTVLLDRTLGLPLTTLAELVVCIPFVWPILLAVVDGLMHVWGQEFEKWLAG